jgi:hypothetical protein
MCFKLFLYIDTALLHKIQYANQLFMINNHLISAVDMASLHKINTQINYIFLPSKQLYVLLFSKWVYEVKVKVNLSLGLIKYHATMKT